LESREETKLTEYLINDEFRTFVEASVQDGKAAHAALNHVSEDIMAATMRTMVLLGCIERTCELVSEGTGMADAARTVVDALRRAWSTNEASWFSSTLAGPSFEYLVAHLEHQDIELIESELGVLME
jgi:hypothetical protein